MSSVDNHSPGGDMKEPVKNKLHINEDCEMSGKELKTQCGGHQQGFVDLGQGVILKQLQKPPRGQRELEFYQQVFAQNCHDPDILELRGFVPPYLGFETSGDTQFLKLHNLTHGFACPCVADIKMGRVTYDQDATEAKKISESSKWPPRNQLGYGLTGMNVYTPGSLQRQSYDKRFGCELTLDNVLRTGLGTFYCLDSGGLRRGVIRSHIQRLRQLEAWFVKQRKFSFIASSVFLVYEGDPSGQSVTSEPNLESIVCKERKAETLLHRVPTNNDLGDSAQDKQKADTLLTPPTLSDMTDVNQAGDYVGEPDVKKLKQCGDNLKGLQDNGTLSNSPGARCNGSSKAKDVDNPTTKADVWLIDFAHVFPATEEDENFLFGLKNLIKSLEELSTLTISVPQPH